MSFNINFETVKLDEFRRILMESNLVPSRVFLKDQAEAYFNLLSEHGFQNLGELLNEILREKEKQLLW